MKKQTIKRKAERFLSIYQLLKRSIIKTVNGQVNGTILRFVSYNSKTLEPLEQVHREAQDKFKSLQEQAQQVVNERVNFVTTLAKENDYKNMPMNNQGQLIAGERYPAELVEKYNINENQLREKHKDYFDQVNAIEKEIEDYYYSSEIEMELMFFEENDLDEILLSGVDNVELFSELIL